MSAINNGELVKTFAAAKKAGLDAVLNVALEKGLQLVGADQGSLMLRNNLENCLEIIKRIGMPHNVKRKYRRFKVGEGIAGWVAEHNQPYLCNDVTLDRLFKSPLDTLSYRSILAVPIVRDHRAVGVICANKFHINSFIQAQVETLSSLAAMVAEAIGSLAVDTFITFAKQVKQLEAIHEVGKELSRLIFESPEDLSKLLEQIAKDAERVLEADLVTLYQYNEHGNRFVVPPTLSGTFNHPEWMKSPVNAGDAHATLVKSGMPHYSNNARQDKIMRAGQIVPASGGLPQRPSFVDREGVKSSAGIPLKSGPETVGIMFINYRTPHPFFADDQRVIETFAVEAALAIQGARRIQDAIRGRQEALQQASRMVAHRLRNVLPVISDRIDRTLSHNYVSDRGSEWCLVALDETRRAQKIVSDFEIFSRAYAFERPNWLSGSELAARLVKVVKENLSSEEASVELQAASDLPLVRVNIERLCDDFINFARDSVRHKPENLVTVIVCEVAGAEDLEHVGLAADRRSFLKLAYADNGPGVPHGLKRRIFEPFYTTTSGSGLGLAIAGHNAKIHGGILIECGRPAGGVRFELYLPIESTFQGEAPKS